MGMAMMVLAKVCARTKFWATNTRFVNKESEKLSTFSLVQCHFPNDIKQIVNQVTLAPQ